MSSGDPICLLVPLYNAWYLRGGGSDCGATNVNTGSSSSTSLFINTTPGQEDFHLAGSIGSTVADNLVDPTTSDYAITTDIDGTIRPVGSNRDAGFDER